MSTNYPQITAHCPALLEQEWQPIDDKAKDGNQYFLGSPESDDHYFGAHGAFSRWDAESRQPRAHWAIMDSGSFYFDTFFTHYRPMPPLPGQPNPTLQALEIALGALFNIGMAEDCKAPELCHHCDLGTSHAVPWTADYARGALNDIKKLGVAR